MANENSKIAVELPGVDFAEMAKQAIAGQLISAMTATPAMIQAIVAKALTQTVDTEGKPRSGGYSSDKPYVQWVAEDMIRKCALDAMLVEFEKMKPEIEKAVKSEIRKSAPAIAKAVCAAYLNADQTRYHTTVEFKVAAR